MTSRNWKIIQIYSKVQDVATWGAFTKICKREGISMSDKLLEIGVLNYVAAHQDGNNQTVLENSGLPKTMPLYQTCRNTKKNSDGRVELIKGEFFCDRQHFWKIPVACGRCDNYRTEIV